MKHFIVLFLISLFGFAQVPNNTTFSLIDVKNEIEDHSTSTINSLQDAFDNARVGGFDSNYSGSKNSLLNFRNYRHDIPFISYELKDMTDLNYTTAASACLGENNFTRSKNTPGRVSNGDIIYTTISSQTPLNGGNLYYSYAYAIIEEIGSGFERASFIVSASGVVSGLTICIVIPAANPVNITMNPAASRANACIATFNRLVYISGQNSIPNNGDIIYGDASGDTALIGASGFYSTGDLSFNINGSGVVSNVQTCN